MPGHGVIPPLRGHGVIPPLRGHGVIRPLLGLTLVGALGAGCPRAGGTATTRPPAANRVRDGHAPTPFDAEQIREACSPGHFRLYRVEVPGRPKLYRVLRFGQRTEEATTFISRQLDADGHPFGEQRRTRARWKALQAHASFPESRTTIRPTRHTTPAGTFDCWLYEVRELRDGHRGHHRRRLRRYWFAKQLPGPPIQLDQRVGGRLTLRMVLVAYGKGSHIAGGTPRPRTAPSRRRATPPRPRTTPRRPRTTPRRLRTTPRRPRAAPRRPRAALPRRRATPPRPRSVPPRR